MTQISRGGTHRPPKPRSQGGLWGGSPRSGGGDDDDDDDDDNDDNDPSPFLYWRKPEKHHLFISR